MPEDILPDDQNNQPSSEETGSETPKQETPAQQSDKQDEGNDNLITEDIFAEEDAKKEPKETPKETPKEPEKSKTEEKPEVKEESPEKPKFDEDLDKWAESKGHDKPENDRERKLLQNLRDSDRQFTRDRQAEKSAKDLNATIEKVKGEVAPSEKETTDPVEKRFQALEADRQAERTTRLQSEFMTANNVSEEVGDIIGKIITEKFTKAVGVEAKAEAIKFWGHPDQLPDLLDLAKARMGAGSSTDVADKAAREERERIEKESLSKGPNRNAKTTVSKNSQSELEKLWDD